MYYHNVSVYNLKLDHCKYHSWEISVSSEKFRVNCFYFFLGKIFSFYLFNIVKIFLELNFHPISCT